jgi:hypothetical protein
MGVTVKFFSWYFANENIHHNERARTKFLRRKMRSNNARERP